MDELSFPCYTDIEKSLVICAYFKRDLNPSPHSKQREIPIFKRIGSLVKMDRTPMFKKHLFRVLQRLQTGCSFSNHIATHLGAKLRQRLSQSAVTKVMQSNAIAFFCNSSNGCNFIASFCEHVLQFTKSFILNCRHCKLNRNGSFHKKEFTLQNCLNTTLRERQFLPALKGWVSLPSIG